MWLGDVPPGPAPHNPTSSSGHGGRHCWSHGVLAVPAELGALPSAPSARPSSARGPVWARASPHRGGLLPPWWEEGPQSSRHPLTRAPEAGGLAAGGHAEAQVSHESQTWRRVVRRHRWKGRNEGTGGKRAGHTSRKGSGRGDPRLQGQKPPPQNQNWSPPYGACPPVSLPRGGFRGQSDGREPRPRAKHRARSLPTPPEPRPGRRVRSFSVYGRFGGAPTIPHICLTLVLPEALQPILPGTSSCFSRTHARPHSRQRQAGAFPCSLLLGGL